MVNIEVEGHDAETYGIANDIITATSHTPRQTAEGSVFTASILVSNESVLQRIVRQITNSI